MRRPAPRLIGFRPLSVLTMELFNKLFGNLLALVYHCFDRIVIHGYLSALSRPEQVVYFFRQVLGVPVVSKEILSQRTADYQSWVEAFARKSSYSDRLGREGRPQGRPCPCLATSNGEEQRLRRLLHFQKHGAGADLPHQHAEISHQGPALPHPCPPAQPLHALLRLHPR